ncbi:MAG TPA: TadE/TadG family type IV pilus assembly protein [Alphaproteobacteria bacterium]|nr:TadE/TadG family type IV pilus assembly protein [Alphaproteobacteria bacterium]
MKRSAPHFLNDQRGTAFLEMAISLPFLLTLLLGVMEISNFVMANERTDKMAYTIADLVSQNENVTTSDLNSIMDASAQIMKPLPFGARGHVIITAVHRDPGGSPYVAWQYEGGGTLHDQRSNFGATGFPSVLPSGFTLNERETVIIAEVYYQYPALVTNMLNSNNDILYKYAFYKPRLGALTTVQSQ